MWRQLVCYSIVALALVGCRGSSTGEPATGKVILRSEFQRLGPDGQVVDIDRGRSPREILSPLVLRNSWTTFLVACQVPPNRHYYVYLAQNPENTFQPRFYKAEFVQVGGSWIPDSLLEVEYSPFSGFFPEPNSQARRQKVTVFVVDLFTPESVEPGRYRFELQLTTGEGWVIYPMEVRVSSVIVPAIDLGTAPELPGPGARIDAVVTSTFREVYCSSSKSGVAKASDNRRLTIRDLVRRNVLQDIALARANIASGFSEGSFLQAVASRLGLVTSGNLRESFCTEELKLPPEGPEWYLDIRSQLYRAAGRGEFVQLGSSLYLAALLH